MSVNALVAALAVACGVGLASAAHAAPLPPAPAGTLAAPFAGSPTDATVQTVAFGCGPGWAPNRWGRCRPIYRGYGYGPRPFYGPRRFYGTGYAYGPPRPFYGPRPVYGPFY